MSMLYVAAAAAAVLGGTSAIMQNRARQQQEAVAAQAADYNAAILKQRSDQTLVAANLREEQKRRMNRVEAGRRDAAIAQSGTGFMGSNTAFAEQQDVNDELDALNIRYQGQLEAKGLLADSDLQHWDAENARAQRSATSGTMLLDTASAALNSGMSVYGAGSAGRSAAGTNNYSYGP